METSPEILAAARRLLNRAREGGDVSEAAITRALIVTGDIDPITRKESTWKLPSRPLGRPSSAPSCESTD